MFGYETQEVEGSHHSLLCDPEYCASDAYNVFWEKLRHGEYHSGEYKRVGKDGKTVWIQATYNPIMGEEGYLWKVIKLAVDVTEQKNNALISRGKVEAISRSQAVVEFDLHGNILDANENFLSLMGYSLAEILDRHHRIFCKPEYAGSNDYKRFWEKLGTGEFHTGEFKRLTKSGAEVWLQASYNPILDADSRPFKVVKFATDISKQKREKAEFGGKIDAIRRSQAVIEFDLQGVILDANANFLDALGYSLEEVKGQHHRMFCEAAYVESEEYSSFWSRLRSGKFESAEYRRLGKGGREVWIQASYNPIFDANGHPFKVVKFATDVTQSKQDQDRWISQLLKSDAEAKAATHAKSQFLASMSHEIRTPLNGVIGMAQSISSEPLSVSQHAKLKILNESSNNLLAIINNILDLTKIEAGKIDLEKIEFGMGSLIRGAYNTFGTIASEKELEYTLDADGVRGVYCGDPTRIRQVIINLISNALKFTKAGNVRIKAILKAGDVEIVVSDSGPGIAADYMSNIFGRFSQADVSTTRNFGGTGLGLAICHELVTLMDGEIRVSSDVGVGTSFTLTLPLQKLAEEVEENEEAEAEPVRLNAEVGSLKVLAADDNATNRIVISTLLSQVGIDVTLVENGAEALEAFKVSSWDLILMDIHMPVMDGVNAVVAIRQEELKRNIARTPIIALTANVMIDQTASYLAAGMDGFVAKPIDLNNLLSEMDMALNASAQEEAGLVEATA